MDGSVPAHHLKKKKIQMSTLTFENLTFYDQKICSAGHIFAGPQPTGCVAAAGRADGSVFAVWMKSPRCSAASQLETIISVPIWALDEFVMSGHGTILKILQRPLVSHGHPTAARHPNVLCGERCSTHESHKLLESWEICNWMSPLAFVRETKKMNRSGQVSGLPQGRQVCPRPGC